MLRTLSSALFVLVSFGCGGQSAKAITEFDTAPTTEEDVDAPEITHEPIDSAQPINQDVQIVATVVDDLSGIDAVVVFYKRPEVAEWKSNALEETDADSGGWGGVIPAADITGGNIVYYLQAIDTAGNENFAPVEGEGNPYGFRVNPDG